MAAMIIYVLYQYRTEKRNALNAAMLKEWVKVIEKLATIRLRGHLSNHAVALVKLFRNEGAEVMDEILEAEGINRKACRVSYPPSSTASPRRHQQTRRRHPPFTPRIMSFNKLQGD